MPGSIHCEGCGRETAALLCPPCQALRTGGDVHACWSNGSVFQAVAHGWITAAQGADLIMEHRRRTTPRWRRVAQGVLRWLGW
jgi:hypothetical protein